MSSNAKNKFAGEREFLSVAEKVIVNFLKGGF